MRDFARKILLERPKATKSITLTPKGKARGNVLLSYGLNACIGFQQGKEVDARHSTAWEAVTIAKTFLEKGFAVDVIGFEDEKFLPRKEYQYFIDVLVNMERISRRLNSDCVKIFHPCFAHWLFHNHAEYRRLHELQERRGYALRPRRTLKANLSVEAADYITIRGDSPYCDSTYKYANKKILNLTHSSNYTYPWPSNKDYGKCNRRFLWLGGRGLVHKGLDLILEAFADLPDNELLICGGVDDEKDFTEAYRKELNELPNVKKLGWTDVGSEKFHEIMNNCIGLIHPSASELTSGSVITCMHGGLIPLVSYQSGTGVHDFGIDLGNCTVQEIKNAILEISDSPASLLAARSRATWEYARAIYTREKFETDYMAVLETIIARH